VSAAAEIVESPAPTYTATARLRVVKPLDGDWDVLGRQLRALRAPLHRVLSAVVRELEIGRTSAPWWAPTDGDVREGRRVCQPRTASYRLTSHFWQREREEAGVRVAKGKPYTGDDVIADTEPSSAAVLGAAGSAFARWGKFDKRDRWKGSAQLPSFRGGSPIYVASSSKAVLLSASDGNVVLDIRLAGFRVGIRVSSSQGSFGRVTSFYVSMRTQTPADIVLADRIVRRLKATVARERALGADEGV
jgi:hypothetical protein